MKCDIIRSEKVLTPATAIGSTQNMQILATSFIGDS